MFLFVSNLFCDSVFTITNLECPLILISLLCYCTPAVFGVPPALKDKGKRMAVMKKLLQKGKAYCLKVPKSRSIVKVELSKKNYQRCVWKIRKHIKRIRWRLKEVELDDLADPDYRCVQ